MNLATLGLAFAAGSLSTLSPCVLPILPIVLTTAATAHKLGPIALAGGLALSFTTIGLFVSTIGLATGIDSSLFNSFAGIMLIVIGVVLAVPALQERAAIVAAPISGWAHHRFGHKQPTGISGQFGVGVLLGAIWSPCVGPTLGAATVLASQGQHISEAGLVMAMFGIGAAMPLLVLGMMSQKAILGMRGGLLGMGRWLRPSLGALLILVGVGSLTGWDKRLEAALLNLSPEWLTRLTTIF